MTKDSMQFTGTWHCRHWYPSKDDTHEEMSERDMRVHRKGNELVFESLPNEEESYLLVRLVLDGDMATGTWYETTSPRGDFKGATYSGAGQLIVEPTKQRLKGMWAGLGFDHKRQKTKVYSGKWDLTRADGAAANK